MALYRRAIKVLRITNGKKSKFIVKIVNCMRFVFFLIVTLFFAAKCFSQTTYSVGSNSVSDGSGHEMDYTFGDVLTSTLQSENRIVTQGYLQPELHVTVSLIDNKEVDLRVYPNPFSEHLEFMFAQSAEIWKVDLLDMSGKSVKETIFSNTTVRSFGWETSELANGSYTVRVFLFDKQLTTSFKVVKN